MTGDPRRAMLENARQRATGDPRSMTIRELLGYWGAKGRGSRVVEQINSDLTAAQLTTEPSFRIGHIDNQIRLVPIADTNPDDTSALADPGLLRVDSLQSALQRVTSVNPNDSIEVAATTMALNDYTQLPVLAGPRSIMGAVTWESIGKARQFRDVSLVNEAIVPVKTVHASEDLLPLLPVVAEEGFVLVLANDRTLGGIITAADITNEFGALAEPFFLLGEIERRLRICLRLADFTREELQAAHAGEREINEVDDLTLGEASRLLEPPANWARLQAALDRRVFLSHLEIVREIRNSLMHFSADLPSDQDVLELRNFLTLLKVWSDPR